MAQHRLRIEPGATVEINAHRVNRAWAKERTSHGPGGLRRHVPPPPPPSSSPACPKFGRSDPCFCCLDGEARHVSPVLLWQVRGEVQAAVGHGKLLVLQDGDKIPMTWDRRHLNPVEPLATRAARTTW